MFPDFKEMQRKFDKDMKEIVDAIEQQTKDQNERLDKIIELLTPKPKAKRKLFPK